MKRVLVLAIIALTESESLSTKKAKSFHLLGQDEASTTTTTTTMIALN